MTTVKAVERWFSDRIQDEITLVRWGTSAAPVLVFPSAGGDAEEIERQRPRRRVRALLAEGRVKLYSSTASPASHDDQGGFAGAPPWLLNQFHELSPA